MVLPKSNVLSNHLKSGLVVICPTPKQCVDFSHLFLNPFGPPSDRMKQSFIKPKCVQFFTKCVTPSGARASAQCFMIRQNVFDTSEIITRQLFASMIIVLNGLVVVFLNTDSISNYILPYCKKHFIETANTLLASFYSI